MRTLIIDDEERGRKVLAAMLKENFPDIELVGEAFDVKSGLEQIQLLHPHLVFLDIQMPDGTGFNLLEQVENYNFEIIFTTAHDEFALEAFNMSAIGYLLKPIDEKELNKAVRKAMQLSPENKRVNYDDKINSLIENYANGPDRMRKLYLADSEGFLIIDIADVVRLEGERNYTYVYFIDKPRILSSHNLGWFEKVLQSKNFFRVSKSSMINLNCVVRYTRADGGVIVMSDQSTVQISDNKKDEFRNLFVG
jgi:two-component system LytT family response regulator